MLHFGSLPARRKQYRQPLRNAKLGSREAKCDIPSRGTDLASVFERNLAVSLTAQMTGVLSWTKLNR